MPQPDPNAPPQSFILNEFSGLKNTVNPERMTAKELVRATNVDLDDAGQLSRRRGFKRIMHGNAHSPFTTFQGPVILVINDVIGILQPDYSFLGLQSGIDNNPHDGHNPIAYAQVGNTVYFSCRSVSGKIDLVEQTVSPWGSPTDLWLSPVVNPTPTLGPVAGRLLAGPPLATTLAYYNGRIYMGVGSTLWATDLYTYDYVDKNAGFKQFEAHITMIGAVGDGIYVGTTEGLWFLSGPTYREMKRERIMDSQVVPGSLVTIPAELGNPPQIPPTSDQPMQIGLGFMTDKGFCVAQDGGQAYNLTESKLFMPGAKSAAAMYRRTDGVNQYIASMVDGGAASAGLGKIGDFVDATIIRGAARGGWTIVPTQTTKLGDVMTPSYPPAGGGTVKLGDSFEPTWV